MSNIGHLTISIQTVLRSLHGAELRGFNKVNLARRVGIPQHLLTDPNARVPLGQFVRLCRITSGLLNDEHYGLLENPQVLGTYKVIAGYAIHARSLNEAIERFSEITNLFNNSLGYHCEVKDKVATLSIHRRHGKAVYDSFAIDIALMIIHRFSSWLINERIALTKVNIDYSSPYDLANQHSEYQYLFYGAPVMQNMPQSSLEFDASYLERPLVQTEQSLHSYLRNAPENLYLPLEESGELSLQVRYLLSSFQETQLSSANLCSVAESLGFTPHKLRRLLKQEGSSFQSIRNAIRREAAIRYLATSEKTIEQIAFSTGYGEAAAFIRAFKHWTGYTPLQFRKHITKHAAPSTEDP